VEETTTCYIAFVPRGKIIEQPGGVWDVMLLDVSHSLHGMIASFLDSSSSPALFFAVSVTHAVYVDAKLQLIKKPKDLVQMLTDDTRRAVMMAL
jgi:hypothetical protein